jgi:BSD domain
LLHDLHTNPDLLHNNPQEPSFVPWQSTFSAEQYTDEIAALLNRYPELRSQMDTLVPEKVSYQEFWMRYLYHKSNIEADEAKRKQLFQDNEDDNDFDWDGDDEDEARQTDAHPFDTSLSRESKLSTETVTPSMQISHQLPEPTTRNSCTSESSTSFDIVSQSSAIPPAMKDKAFVTSGDANFQVSHTVEESDDDWE